MLRWAAIVALTSALVATSRAGLVDVHVDMSNAITNANVQALVVQLTVAAKQVTATALAWEGVGYAWSGAGSNVSAYAATAKQDKEEWHKILVAAWNQFWPYILAIVAACAYGARKLYKYKPQTTGDSG